MRLLPCGKHRSSKTKFDQFFFLFLFFFLENRPHIWHEIMANYDPFLRKASEWLILTDIALGLCLKLWWKIHHHVHRVLGASPQINIPLRKWENRVVEEDCFLWLLASVAESCNNTNQMLSFQNQRYIRADLRSLRCCIMTALPLRMWPNLYTTVGTQPPRWTTCMLIYLLKQEPRSERAKHSHGWSCESLIWASTDWTLEMERRISS